MPDVRVKAERVPDPAVKTDHAVGGQIFSAQGIRDETGIECCQVFRCTCLGGVFENVEPVAVGGAAGGRDGGADGVCEIRPERLPAERGTSFAALKLEACAVAEFDEVF